MKLETYLKQAGWTQEQLAAAIKADDGIGITQGAISHWVVKNRVPVARAVQLERVTGGQLKASELRPDVFGPKTKDVAA